MDPCNIFNFLNVHPFSPRGFFTFLVKYCGPRCGTHSFKFPTHSLYDYSDSECDINNVEIKKDKIMKFLIKVLYKYTHKFSVKWEIVTWKRKVLLKSIHLVYSSAQGSCFHKPSGDVSSGYHGKAWWGGSFFS